jgi:Ca2+-binding RTX toxin-like protein
MEMAISNVLPQILGTLGDDIITLQSETSSLFIKGLGGNNKLTGSRGGDSITGNQGNDVLNGGKGDDALFGDKGDDILLGGAGSDFLKGGAGIDILRGGKGVDVLRGGVGGDYFHFRSIDFSSTEVDTIQDFSRSQGDKLSIEGFNFGTSTISYGSSGSVNFDIDSNGKTDLTIKFTKPVGTLTADDFQYVQNAAAF